MERMKTKIILAVADRLKDAKESDAKTELIEELSENLYQRCVDLIASGMEENEAYSHAMEDLGDVGELLAYLEEMESGESAQSDSRSGKEHFNDFLRGLEDVVRETIVQTKDAVDQAKIIAKDLSRKFNEKYPDGVKIHCGYDSGKGGFFWENNSKGQPVEIATIPADTVKALDVQLHNGDVDVRVADQDSVGVHGEAEDLEIRLDDDGVLYIRQGKTATSSVIFGRGLARTNLELVLPEKNWDSVRINTVNGDVKFNDALEAGTLEIRTVSGDINVECATSPRMNLVSVSGDICGEGLTGGVTAGSKSGDVTLGGDFSEAVAESLSGDVSLTGMAGSISCSSMSGDVNVESGVLPGRLDVSSKSGDCSVRIPAGEGFIVNLHTISGDFSTDFELVGTIGRKSGSAVYLDGGNRSFSVSSISGDIELKRL